MTKSRHRCPLLCLLTVVRCDTPLTQVIHCCSGNAQYYQYCSVGGRKKKGIGGLLLVKHCLPPEERYWAGIALSPLTRPSLRKDGRKGGGPTRCISIHWKSVWERERYGEGGGVEGEPSNKCRGTKPVWSLIRDWLPLESIINTRAAMNGITGSNRSVAHMMTWLQSVKHHWLNSGMSLLLRSMTACHLWSKCSHRRHI